MLNDLQAELHKQSADAGWWKDHEVLPTEYAAYRLSRLHKVISEALDIVRKGENVTEDDIIQNINSAFISSRNLTDIPSETIIIGTKIALLHSEVSEAFDGLETGAMDKHLPHRTEIEVELADALIRLLDLSGRLGLDLEGAIKEKQEYNKNRADHQIENRNKTNGKQF